MTSQGTRTCRYCHAKLPRRVSLATHYGTCPVLANVLVPATPFPNHPKISEAETPRPSRGAGEASRADQQRGIELARDRLKAEKQK